MSSETTRTILFDQLGSVAYILLYSFETLTDSAAV